jgi:hypothetical protein
VECCTELKCESGLKNNYFLGKRLTPDTFLVEQQYLVERRRLLNRAIHGWGVVYGYAITPDPSDDSYQKKPLSRKLKIDAGLALDKCGRELLQVGTLQLGLNDVIFVDDEAHRIDPQRAFPEAEHPGRKKGQDPPPVCWLLSVHYAEQAIGLVTINDPCSCERHEWDHVCETVRYSLRRIDCDKCCNDFPCELECDCRTGPCCNEHDKDLTDEHDPRRHDEKYEAERQRQPCKPFTRGGCQCLCEHLTSLRPGDEPCSLCEIEEPCARVRVDLRHGVPLACVKLIQDDCDSWTFDVDVEACGPRRLVKRNDLLFDLIRGCDLTRISDIGWKDWHRREAAIPFNDFSQAFGGEGKGKTEYVTNKFTVEFSRPVRQETLRPDCFAITVMSVETEGGWWQVLRVPIVRVDTTSIPPKPGDPANHVRGATLVVDGAWVEDGLRGRRSVFLAGETRVEIEVRGDFIVDCNGQTVDANVRGLCGVPSGNGAPGGTFLSSFGVVVKGASS